MLEPIADGFRNYLKGKYAVSAEELLVDKAQLLTLTAPEMTVLVGGMRALNATSASPSTASSPRRPEALTNDFFGNPRSSLHRRVALDVDVDGTAVEDERAPSVDDPQAFPNAGVDDGAGGDFGRKRRQNWSSCRSGAGAPPPQVVDDGPELIPRCQGVLARRW